MASDDVGARVTTLRSPALGLTRYINVREPVGPNQRNHDVDCRIVGALLANIVEGRVEGAEVPKMLRYHRFTATIGFWIFHFQLTNQKLYHTSVDGIVSPSNDIGRYSGGYHTILLINAEVRRKNPTFFDAVCDGRRALTPVD